jgi:hypothetical protein
MSNLHSHLLTLIHTIFICFCICVDIDTLLLLLVYEIVAQREPHSDKDPFQVFREIRSVCVFESLKCVPLIIIII